MTRETLEEIEAKAREDAAKIPDDELFQETDVNLEYMADWRVIEVTGYEIELDSLLLEIDNDEVVVLSEELAPLFALHNVGTVDDLIGCEVPCLWDSREPPCPIPMVVQNDEDDYYHFEFEDKHRDSIKHLFKQ